MLYLLSEFSQVFQINPLTNLLQFILTLIYITALSRHVLILLKWNSPELKGEGSSDTFDDFSTKQYMYNIIILLLL